MLSTDCYTYVWYSKKQENYMSRAGYLPKKILLNGSWQRYTELITTNRTSDFDDAIMLGTIHYSKVLIRQI